MQGRHIAISGVVGAGKTTLVRGLSKELDYLPLEERFTENPYLTAFYEDPPAWAFKSYVFFLQRTLDDYLRARASNRGGVQERVLQEHLEIFGEEFRARNYLDRAEFELLSELTNTSMKAVPRPDLLLYIDIAPEEALRRVRRRANPSESEVTLDYLASLSERYDQMLALWSSELLRIDGNAHDLRDPTCVAALATAVRSRLGAAF